MGPSNKLSILLQFFHKRHIQCVLRATEQRASFVRSAVTCVISSDRASNHEEMHGTVSLCAEPLLSSGHEKKCLSFRFAPHGGRVSKLTLPLCAAAVAKPPSILGFNCRIIMIVKKKKRCFSMWLFCFPMSVS